MKRNLQSTVVFLTIVLLWNASALSQHRAKISGVVIDMETKIPIGLVNLILRDTPFGAATDTLGHYEIAHIPADLYVLEIRHVAYKTRFHVLRIQPGEEITLMVELEQEVIKFGQVEVTAEAAEAKRLHQTYASKVIKEEEIKRSGAVRLTDLLSTFEPGSLSRTLRRQFDRAPFLIYLDGSYVSYIPGSLDNIVDVSQIERIEISRWVGAAPNFGPGTSDRVLQIFTKKPGK